MSEELVRLEITAQEEDYEGITGLLCLKLSSGWEEESLATGETLFGKRFFACTAKMLVLWTI